jgi:hypothetical protein
MCSEVCILAEENLPTCRAGCRGSLPGEIRMRLLYYDANRLGSGLSQLRP